MATRTIKFNISSSLSYIDKLKIYTLSNEHRLLWNHLLGWCQENRADFKQLNQEYVKFRNENELTIPSKSAQNTCRAFINAILGFYALKENDPTARFPYKFKSWKHFTSFTYDWNQGCGGFKLTEDKLILLKPRVEIALPNFLKNIDLSDVKLITFTFTDGKYWLHVVYDQKVVKKESSGNWLSIDPGLSSIITGITNTGIAIQYSNTKFTHLEKSVDHLKSIRDKKVKYSKRYERIKALVKKTQKKLSCKQKYFHHKLTREVIDFCQEHDISKIIHGDIKTKSLTKSKVAHSGLNKSSQNRGTLSRVKQFLAYKAEEVGIAHVLQNEAWTSKTNCYTGEIIQDMTLSTRTIEIEPGLSIDRDVNGAINIAQKNLGVWLPQLEWIREISILKRYVVV